MVVALLCLIVLILLFGAGVVKGWLLNTAGVVGGILAITFTLVWLSSFLGENGVLYVCMILLALIGLGWLAGQHFLSTPTPKRVQMSAKEKERRQREREQRKAREETAQRVAESGDPRLASKLERSRQRSRKTGR